MADPEATEQTPATPPAGAGGGETEPAAADAAAGLDFVLDVPLRLTVEVGSARLLVREVLQLDKGSVVELDRASGEAADVRVNGRLVGRGDVTVVDDRLAVRLTEIVAGGRTGAGEG